MELLGRERTLARLDHAIAIVAAAPSFTAKEMEAEVTAWLGREGLQLKDVAQAARVALTGRSASPGLFQVLAVLGRDVSLARLARGASQAAARAPAGQ